MLRFANIRTFCKLRLRCYPSTLGISAGGIRTIRKLGVDAAAKKYNVDLKKYTVNSGPPVRSVNVHRPATRRATLKTRFSAVSLHNSTISVQLSYEILNFVRFAMKLPIK